MKKTIDFTIKVINMLLGNETVNSNDIKVKDDLITYDKKGEAFLFSFAGRLSSSTGYDFITITKASGSVDETLTVTANEGAIDVSTKDGNGQNIGFRLYPRDIAVVGTNEASSDLYFNSLERLGCEKEQIPLVGDYILRLSSNYGKCSYQAQKFIGLMGWQHSPDSPQDAEFYEPDIPMDADFEPVDGEQKKL